MRERLHPIQDEHNARVASRLSAGVEDVFRRSQEPLQGSLQGAVEVVFRVRSGF